MRLTDEQRNAVKEPGHVCLVSCPGSGKTRVIVAKLLYCIDEVQNTTRRIACITHTNAAADEIETRLRETCFSGEDRYYDVSTIHGFALENILRPYARLLPEFRNGFTILTADSEIYAQVAKGLLQNFNLKAGLIEEFERIQRRPDGSFGKIDTLPVALQKRWCKWLDDNACTTLGDIVYHSARLIKTYDHIASAMASHFAWVLVDEFQDSSPGQLLILRAIHEFGRTRFFCVGDPNQSIYRFAGASPALLYEFAADIGANTDHELTGNFRSSENICAHADKLHPAGKPMKAVGPHAKCPIVPIHRTVAKPLDGILGIFLPAVRELGIPLGKAAILAPWWTSLFNVARELRALKIPAIGPGARPYKRLHLISHLLEPVGAYLENPDTETAIEVQRALFFLIANLTRKSPHLAFDFSGRLIICRLLAEAAAAAKSSTRAVDWITETAERFAAVLTASDLFSPEAALLLRQSAAGMVGDILSRNGGDALKVEDMGIFARPKECLQLLTVHKGKGREFEAVAVIDAHRGRFPHFSIDDLTDQAEIDAEYAESRRLVYVATTRAKRILMFFSDKTHHRNTPTPFLAEMGL